MKLLVLLGLLRYFRDDFLLPVLLIISVCLVCIVGNRLVGFRGKMRFSRIPVFNLVPTAEANKISLQLLTSILSAHVANPGLNLPVIWLVNSYHVIGLFLNKLLLYKTTQFFRKIFFKASLISERENFFLQISTNSKVYRGTTQFVLPKYIFFLQ